MDLSTLARRLKVAMADQGLSQFALAKKAGISQAAIQKLASGKAKSTTYLIPISNALNVRPEWLSLGTGPMRDEPNTGVTQQNLRPPRRDAYRVEVLDITASAGHGVSARDEFIETIKSIEYSNDEARALFGGRPQEHIKMIAVNGDSMSGTFEPRDQIFLDITINYFDGDGIYIFVLDNILYVKRLQLQYKRLAVISDNKKYETWYIDKDSESNLVIVAKVLISQSRGYKIHG